MYTEPCHEAQSVLCIFSAANNLVSMVTCVAGEWEEWRELLNEAQ